MTASADQRPVIVIGDRAGNVSMLDRNGQRLWVDHISRFSIRQLAFSPDRQMIVGADERGRVFFYNRAGQRLYAEPQTTRRSQVAAFTADGQDMIALRYDGNIDRLALSQASGLPSAGSFRLLFPFALVGLTIAAGAGAIFASDSLTARARVVARRLHAGRVAYMLLIPTFALLIVFKYYPVGTAFWHSFTNFSLTKPAEWVGLKNYVQMYDDQYVRAGMLNMLIFLVTNLAKTLTIPLLVAELIFWLTSDRLKQLFRTAFVMPSIVPGVVFVLLWVQIYDADDGLINNILFSLGWMDRSNPTSWLSESAYALWAIVFAGFPWVSVFAFLILMGGLINISTDVFEAARIDGAGTWKRFWRIDLPMIMPQIKLLTIFTFIGSIQDFTRVLIFTNGGPGTSTYVPALQMFRQIADGANLGYASAIGAVLFVLVLALTVLVLRGWRTYDE
jgi:ABC-type sugar transport system permease subunit